MLPCQLLQHLFLLFRWQKICVYQYTSLFRHSHQLHKKVSIRRFFLIAHQIFFLFIRYQLHLIILWLLCRKNRKPHHTKTVLLAIASQLLTVCRCIDPAKYGKSLAPSCRIFLMNIGQKVKIHQNLHLCSGFRSQIIRQIFNTSGNDHHIPGGSSKQAAPLSCSKLIHKLANHGILQICLRIFLHSEIIQIFCFTYRHLADTCKRRYLKTGFCKFLISFFLSKLLTVQSHIIFLRLHLFQDSVQNDFCISGSRTASQNQDFFLLAIPEGKNLQSFCPFPFQNKGRKDSCPVSDSMGQKQHLSIINISNLTFVRPDLSCLLLIRGTDKIGFQHIPDCFGQKFLCIHRNLSVSLFHSVEIALTLSFHKSGRHFHTADNIAGGCQSTPISAGFFRHSVILAKWEASPYTADTNIISSAVFLYIFIHFPDQFSARSPLFPQKKYLTGI